MVCNDLPDIFQFDLLAQDQLCSASQLPVHLRGDPVHAHLCGALCQSLKTAAEKCGRCLQIIAFPDSIRGPLLHLIETLHERAIVRCDIKYALYCILCSEIRRVQHTDDRQERIFSGFRIRKVQDPLYDVRIPRDSPLRLSDDLLDAADDKRRQVTVFQILIKIIPEDRISLSGCIPCAFQDHQRLSPVLFP